MFSGREDDIISSSECVSGPEVEEDNNGYYRAEGGSVHMNK